METEDVMPFSGNAVDNLGASEPSNAAGGGRNGILDSGPAVGSDVECKEKTIAGEEVLEASQSGDDGLGATRSAAFEGGDEKNSKGGMLAQCAAGNAGAVEQVPSGVDTAVQDTMVSDTVMKDAETEARYEAQAGVIAGEEETDSVMKHVAIEAATDVSSLVKEDAVAPGETQSLQVDSPSELSKRLNTKLNGSVNTSPNCSSEIANAREAEECLLRSRVLSQKTETIENRDDTMISLETLTVVQDSRKDDDRYRINSNMADVVAAGVAAGVAEGIAESIVETIAKETAGASGQGSMEGRVFDSSRFERMAIAKAVAEVIAESVAQEVAQGMADGLAEAAATAEAFNEVQQKKPDNIRGMPEASNDGVLCDCGLVAVVRVVGEKSPNRGLRYLMCSLQDPSFFKRKGKRRDSDTIGKCKFFSWLDTPRHTSKEDKKNQEKEKTHLEESNASPSTRSPAKESNLVSPIEVGTLPCGEGGEVSPSEIPTSTNTEDTLLLPDAPEFIPDLKLKPTRNQRKKGLAEVSGTDDILDADWPASAGTLTRSALRKGAPESVQELSLDTSAVSTPVSALGKRTIDWTDSYIGPESQMTGKGVSFRKRRSVRGESGASSRYSTGGSGSGRGIGFGSSEKKPLHYFRRSTGQVGALDGVPINLDLPNPMTDVQNPGAREEDEKDNRFKSYYKKGKIGRSLEPKSKNTSVSTSDKLQLGAGKSRVNRAAEEASPVETEKKTKLQTRRQQRKLPLSEVYGALLPVTSKRTNTVVAKDRSLSPSRQPLGKSTTSGVASEPKEVGHSKSPPKKRKLSWVLSEDSVVQETDTPKRTSARKGNSSTNIDSGTQNPSFSMVETPLLASAFPTVRYEAKLPAEDYHDPDDPWSLEIPWAKQEHEKERAQQLKEKDERDGEAVEGQDSEVKREVRERTEAVNEAAAIGEELAGFENSGGICGPVTEGKDCDIPGSHLDQETINTVVDTGTSLVDGQEVGEVLKENHVDIGHEVFMMPLQTEGEVVHRSEGPSNLPLDTGSLLSAPDVSGQSVQKYHVLENAQELILGGMNDSEVPEEEVVILQGQQTSVLPDEQSTDDKTQTNTDHSCHAAARVGEATTEDVVLLEDNVLLESVAPVSKDSLPKLDDIVETDDRVETGAIVHRERSEPPGACSDAPVTIEGDLVLSEDRHEVDDLQGNVEGIGGPIEEFAISGSNLIAAGGAGGRVGQVTNHEPERDSAHASPDQDAAVKSPRETDNAGAAAASENAGFVNSVWRLASGKKTRSIGSIGAPAVTSKRSRSVVPSQKGGPKRDRKPQAEVQWVDVPLDWRNEKSTGRVPLLPNFSGKGLNGSDTTQSEMRLLQSTDTSQGTHSARPRFRRGEIDDSSIITEEKEKDPDACNEDSMDYNAQVANVVAHAGQATLGTTAMGDEASVPAGDHGLVRGPTNQQAVVTEDVVQKRKRGRPRKDSKKAVGLQYSVGSEHEVDTAGGAIQAQEPELAGVVGKADGEPSSMILCSTTLEGNTTAELHAGDRVSQLERSASNTERENGKPEGVSSEPDECGRSLDGSDVPSDVPSATLEGLQSEIIAPHCLCKVIPRQAVLKTVVRSGDINQGLRYWSCSNYRKLFTKKRKSPSDVTEESCNYFRWLDTPRVTAKDQREARKERYRQVELQRLL